MTINDFKLLFDDLFKYQKLLTDGKLTDNDLYLLKQKVNYFDFLINKYSEFSKAFQKIIIAYNSQKDNTYLKK